MPKPQNKAQLLAAIQKEYDALEAFLAALTPEQMAYADTPGAWAVKDIIAHLHAWHEMLFTWYETGLRGETPAVPAPGYKWSQMPALNQMIYEKYRDLSPEAALALFRASHQKTLRWAETLPEEELTTPGRYPWMNANTLMAYINSCTAAHYVWAKKEARKALKSFA